MTSSSPVRRKLVAILAADVAGSSRLMEEAEEDTVARLTTCRAMIHRLVSHHRGRVFGGAGDSVVAEFASPVEAVRCAVRIQLELQRQDSGSPPERRVRFRIGVNLGDVVVDGNNLLGDGVNVAARLESLAVVGGVCVSASVHEQIAGKVDVQFDDAGEHRVKNIARPIRVWRWVPEAVGIAAPTVEPEARGVHDSPSVAVLPFVNISGDVEQDYFSDGITEDITIDLSGVSGLYVAARNSSFTYKGVAEKVERIGQELGVRYVLEGSVRKSGRRVRIAAQLIDTTTGGHLWAERFDRDLNDVFAVQDEITHRIVESLRVTLLPLERRAIAKVPTSDVEAYRFYLLGRQQLRRHTRSSYAVAKRMFEKALDLDPNYARARAGLADCDCFLYLNYYLADDFDGILEATATALKLEPDLAEAHASRGLALATLERHDEAEDEFQTALDLDPDLYEAVYFYARACMTQGRQAKASELFRRAAEIRPDDFESLILLMVLCTDMGDAHQAEVAGREGLARAEAELQLRPENVRAVYMGAAQLAAAGEHTRAREWIDRALTMEPDDFLTQYNGACVYAQLGDVDTALDLLERALPNAHAEIHSWAEHDSTLDPIRQHPRYRALFAEHEPRSG